MTRTDKKFVVDVLLFACLGAMVGIGLLMGFVLAEGPARSGAEKIFLGLHRHQWGLIHFWASLAFTELLIQHLILNRLGCEDEDSLGRLRRIYGFEMAAVREAIADLVKESGR